MQAARGVLCCGCGRGGWVQQLPNACLQLYNTACDGWGVAGVGVAVMSINAPIQHLLCAVQLAWLLWLLHRLLLLQRVHRLYTGCGGPWGVRVRWLCAMSVRWVAAVKQQRAASG